MHEECHHLDNISAVWKAGVQGFNRGEAQLGLNNRFQVAHHFPYQTRVEWFTTHVWSLCAMARSHPNRALGRLSSNSVVDAPPIWHIFGEIIEGNDGVCNGISDDDMTEAMIRVALQ
ncbi:hypothetical protein N7537_012269 [Penicillium hordei]|jgi:hypothetical protein|uniref:Uncharacterized protein n=1 Tax=Penicillium hordei TaxID=40994 RepID=A0AAD6GSJ3_9EURO|nr:uncharacterized protein N7537_012269 [Penicillium hordei]KAJ5589591.1 hypothetical protein N7537_012269 [Penicillium hordei]